MTPHCPLATDLVLTAVNLKERDGALAVNLVAWRMSQVTLGLRKRGGSEAGTAWGVVGKQPPRTPRTK